MYHCYKKVKEIGGIAQVHAENGVLIAEVLYLHVPCDWHARIFCYFYWRLINFL